MSKIKLIEQLYENYSSYKIDKETIKKLISKLVLTNEEDEKEQIRRASLIIEQYIAKEIKNKNSAIKEIVKSKFEYIKVFIKRTNKMLDDEQIDKIYDAAIDKSCRQYDTKKMFDLNVLDCAKKLSRDLFFIESLSEKSEKKIISPKIEKEVKEIDTSKKEQPIIQNDTDKKEEPIVQVDSEKTISYRKKLTNQLRNLSIMNKYIKVYNMKKSTLCKLIKVNKSQLESILLGDTLIQDYKLYNLYSTFSAHDYVEFIKIIREKIEKREKVLESQSENKSEETTIKEKKVKINIYKDLFKSISDSDLEKICNELGYKKTYFKRMLIHGEASIKESEFQKILNILNMSEDELKERQESISKLLQKQNNKIEKNGSKDAKNDEKVSVDQYRDYFNSLSEENKNKIESAIDMKYISFYKNYLSCKKLLSKIKFEKILEALGFENEEQLKNANKKFLEEQKVSVYQYKDYFNSLTKEEKDKIASAIDVKYSTIYTDYLSRKKLLLRIKFEKILESLGFENEEQLKEVNEKFLEEQKVSVYQYKDYFNSLTKEEQNKIASAIDMKYKSFYKNYLICKKLLLRIKFEKILKALGFENEEQLKEINEKFLEAPKIQVYQYKDYFNSLTKEEQNKIASTIDLKYSTFYTEYLCRKKLLSKTKFDKILEILGLENEGQLKEINEKFLEAPKIQVYQYKDYFNSLTKEEKNKIASTIDLKYSTFYTEYLCRKKLLSKTKFDKILEILGLENEGPLKEANEKAIESQNIAMYKYRDYFSSLTKEEQNKIASAIDLKYKSFYQYYLCGKKLMPKENFDKILEVLELENEEELKEENRKVIELPNVSIYQYKDYFSSLTKEEKNKLEHSLNIKYSSFYRNYLYGQKLLKRTKFDKILEVLGFKCEEDLKEINEKLIVEKTSQTKLEYKKDESQSMVLNNYSELFNLILKEVNREVLLQLIETKFDKEDILIANLLLGGYKDRYYSPEAISNFLGINKKYVLYVFRRSFEEYKLLCNKVSGINKSEIDDILSKTYEIDEK